jgi:Ca2+-binding RTX toxin-like protein
VLVAGGSPGTNVLSSAEVFDPATNAFSSAGIGSMTIPRMGAAAAPLPGGRVLVAGGWVNTAPYVLSSAEVFDPATRTFSSAGIGSMSVPRKFAVAAPLPDGRVLVAGGDNSDGYLSSAEVFDPATNSFSSAGIGSMSVRRSGAAAAPLPDGRVVVAGGYFYGDNIYPCVLSSAEVFDPATNSFSSGGIGSMGRGRYYAAAAALPDGVLVVGGNYPDFLGRGGCAPPAPQPLSAEVFDPATGTFSSEGIGSTSVGRDRAAAALLPGSRALVAGGEAFNPDVGASALSSAEIFAPGSAPSNTCRGEQATIAGTDGADRITGTPGADVIAARGGNDRVSGLAGKDLICGGKGNDTLKGGAGKDQLSGQKGNDKLYGQRGNDKLRGKAGKDTLTGGPGKDILKGGPGRDKQVQ